MTARLFMMGAFAATIAVASPSLATGAGQERRKEPASAATAKSYEPPRTAWGDPNLQGNFTNKYEQSTPFERPPEFAGRRVEDVKGAELDAILRERQRQVLDRPAGVGPLQFRDELDVTRGSRAWLVVDPPDGRIPPLTVQAERRFAAPAEAVLDVANTRRRSGSSFGDGPFDGPEDLSLFDRCITRGMP